MQLVTLRLSINLRYSKSVKPLLAFDVFCTAPGESTLAEIYAKTASNAPANYMSTYLLRAEKPVYVLCEKDTENTHCSAEETAESIADLRPIRLIFCVRDAPPPPPGPRGLFLNVRIAGEDSEFFPDDLSYGAENPDTTVADVWKFVTDTEPELEKFQVRCLTATRPVDGVGMMIAMTERMIDVAATGPRRYVFDVLENEEEMEHDDADERDVDDELDELDEFDADEIDEEDELGSSGEQYDSDETGSCFDENSGGKDREAMYHRGYNYRAERKQKAPRSILRQPGRRNSNNRRSAAR